METIKPGNPVLEKVQNVMLTSNYQSAQKAVVCAQQLGFNSILLTTYLQGEARYAGSFLANILQEIAYHGLPFQRPACIVVGGETTVTLKGNGLGGAKSGACIGVCS